VGTTVVCPTRASAYHQDWGDIDPEEFSLKRWTPQLMEVHAHKWETGTEAFAPFGTGGRRCYGRQLAMATMRLVVARFVVGRCRSIL
jgi:cytochrome P450